MILSVSDEPGISIMIEELYKVAKHPSESCRAGAMHLLERLCANGSVDLNDHVSQLLVFTLETFCDSSERVCQWAWSTLDALVTKVRTTTCVLIFVKYE